jgi:hypothetical protein
LVSGAIATPAAAALIMNADGSVTTSGTGGGSVLIKFNGLTDGPTLVPGLAAELTLTFSSVSPDGKTYNFAYSLFNSSSGQVTGSRISSFGFNTDPNVAGGSATGLFDVLHLGDSYPIIDDPEVCLFNPNGRGGVCTGSGGGLSKGQTGTGTLSLRFSSVPVGSSITLSNFVDRYQSITGVAGVTSAVGQQVRTPPPPPVPEPGTWAMMLVGFGGMGLRMRRRAKRLSLQVS